MYYIYREGAVNMCKFDNINVYNVLLTCQLDIVDAVIQLLSNILHYPLIYPTIKMII